MLLTVENAIDWNTVFWSSLKDLWILCITIAKDIPIWAYIIVFILIGLKVKFHHKF